jgi:LysR family cys regulon transcriptional activator
MNFQQLRSVREAVRSGFNLTDVAQILHTSQPGVSRQIRELEEELGVDIFLRAGKRLTGLTQPGAELLPIVERLLLDADNLRRVGADFSASAHGQLSIAATHSQARYALPQVVQEFRQHYPQVRLHLHQGSPKQVAQMLLSGEADLGVATEALAGYEGLVTLPCYRWTHSVVLPPGHPLLQHELPLTDVIKTYVELGMGVGIVASVALDPERDLHLHALDAGHLFEVNVTRLGLRRGAWLRGYAYDFMQRFVPTLTLEVIAQTLQGKAPAV